ncbi:MAG: hypothetical protein LLF76_01395 [Planctomycetaceae bacterium]|nr:hypothetical protein [Planctomycetaceae bacterium]
MFCRIYQWQIEIGMDDGHPLSDRLNKHIAGCARCRQHAAGLERLAKVMSAETDQSQMQNLGPLQLRIIHTLSAQRLDKLDARQLAQIHHAKWCAAAMAACLLATASILTLNYTQPKKQFETTLSSLSIAAKALQTPLPRLAELSEKPIRSEVNKLKADSHNVVIFLWNCIPHFEPSKDDSEQAQ